MKYFFWWLFAAVPVTALCLGIYIADQQVYRQSANDPQIQLAEDGATRLNNGGVPADLVPRGSLTNLSTSLDTWTSVYDQSGMPLEASAQLDNAPPKLPSGVFDTTNASAKVDDPIWKDGEYRFTWQPRAGVRQAMVLVRADNGYFVAAGRSLRLSEERTHQLGINMIFGWAATLVGILVVQLLYHVFVRRVKAGSAR